MVKYLVFVVIVVLVGACECKQDELSLDRVSFQGEFRTDGYYYNTNRFTNLVDLYIFYNNGVLIDYYEKGETLLVNIDEELRNNDDITFFSRNRDGYGVFQVLDSILSFENWSSPEGMNSCNPVFTGIGEILNDTTLLLFGDQVYHFRQFSPKPDSTNMWIN